MGYIYKLNICFMVINEETQEIIEAIEVKQCPNGCAVEEIETISGDIEVGIPYGFVCHGCGLFSRPADSFEGAVNEWNTTVDEVRTSGT